MIRKLRSGEYRLYSRKVNPKTSAATSAPSNRARRPKSTSRRCSISSGISATRWLYPAYANIRGVIMCWP